MLVSLYLLETQLPSWHIILFGVLVTQSASRLDYYKYFLFVWKTKSKNLQESGQNKVQEGREAKVNFVGPRLLKHMTLLILALMDEDEVVLRGQ